MLTSEYNSKYLSEALELTDQLQETCRIFEKNVYDLLDTFNLSLLRDPRMTLYGKNMAQIKRAIDYCEKHKIEL